MYVSAKACPLQRSTYYERQYFKIGLMITIDKCQDSTVLIHHGNYQVTLKTPPIKSFERTSPNYTEIEIRLVTFLKKINIPSMKNCPTGKKFLAFKFSQIK